MKWRLVVVSSVFLILAGCTTDSDPGNPAPVDAGVAFDTAVQDASSQDASAERLTADGFIDLFDVFPIPDGPASTCVNCVRDRCGAEINGCANSDPCRLGLACALTTCIAMPAEGGPGGAGLDQACLFGCFMGNLGALTSAAGAFTCIGMSCTAACAAGGVGD
jgi:hypothetical protein